MTPTTTTNTTTTTTPTTTMTPTTTTNTTTTTTPTTTITSTMTPTSTLTQTTTTNTTTTATPTTTITTTTTATTTTTTTTMTSTTATTTTGSTTTTITSTTATTTGSTSSIFSSTEAEIPPPIVIVPDVTTSIVVWTSSSDMPNKTGPPTTASGAMQVAPASSSSTSAPRILTTVPISDATSAAEGERHQDSLWSTSIPNQPSDGSESGDGQSIASAQDDEQVVTGVFKVSVPDAERFVQSPYARSMAAASVARLAQVSEDQVVVELLDVDGRRLRAVASRSTVDIDYIIRAVYSVAQPMAESLRLITHAAASQVFSEEMARFADTRALPSIAIEVIGITARSPQPAPGARDPVVEAQPQSSSLTGSVTFAIIGSIMGAFCMIQIVPCLCDRFHPYREAIAWLFRGREELKAATSETPRSVRSVFAI
mmetsp:Transcript_7562/g.20726  ORF Transcript_7562/g.20726 Transcript_7562/m.20726 type:complete len:427 (-) Transcript_7562:111-1391(-)